MTIRRVYIARGLRRRAVRVTIRRVYIASPYTVGYREENVRRSLLCYHQLRDKGFFPFAPLLSHYLQLVQHRDYEDWMEIDFEWLRSCDAVLRLDGESRGADREVSLAVELGIPVFYSVEALDNTEYLF